MKLEANEEKKMILETEKMKLTTIIAKTQSDINDLKYKIMQSTSEGKGKVNAGKITKMEAELEEKQRALEKASVSLEAIDSELSSLEKRNYNKSQVINNIRTLLKASNVKLGDIEREASATPGYLSRLEKESRASSELSLNFVVTSAKMLGVSVDSLLGMDSTSTNETVEQPMNIGYKDALRREKIYNEELKELIESDDKEKALKKIERTLNRISESLLD